jgi:hypothetical protein
MTQAVDNRSEQGEAIVEELAARYGKAAAAGMLGFVSLAVLYLGVIYVVSQR